VTDPNVLHRILRNLSQAYRNLYLVYESSVNTTNTTNKCFPLRLSQHVSTHHMSHHQAEFEPLNIFEFLLTVLFVSKAADSCPVVTTHYWTSSQLNCRIPLIATSLVTTSAHSPPSTFTSRTGYPISIKLYKPSVLSVVYSVICIVL
jgi:hypothetical protein